MRTWSCPQPPGPSGSAVPQKIWQPGGPSSRTLKPSWAPILHSSSLYTGEVFSSSSVKRLRTCASWPAGSRPQTGQALVQPVVDLDVFTLQLFARPPAREEGCVHDSGIAARTFTDDQSIARRAARFVYACRGRRPERRIQGGVLQRRQDPFKYVLVIHVSPRWSSDPRCGMLRIPDDCPNAHSQRLVTASISDGRPCRSYFPYIDDPESRNLLILRVLDVNGAAEGFGSWRD